MLKNKIIIISALMVVMIITWFVVIYMPDSKNIGKMKDRLAVLEEKERQGISERKVHILENHIESLNKKLKSNLDRIYPQQQLVDLGGHVEKIGKQYHLRLVSIFPEYSSLSQLHEGGQEFNELHVTIEFAGLFHRVAEFLDNIDEFPFVIRVNGVTLEKKIEKQSELKITLQGVIVLRKERAHDSNVKQNRPINRA